MITQSVNKIMPKLNAGRQTGLLLYDGSIRICINAER